RGPARRTGARARARRRPPRRTGARPSRPAPREAVRPWRSYPGEFLKRADLPRRLQILPEGGPRHLGHVEVAARADHAPVGSEDLARLLPGEAAPDPAYALALERDDAPPRADVGHLGADRERRRELADVQEPAAAAVGEEAAWPIEVLELGEGLALVVEDLDAMVLAVGGGHRARGVGGGICRGGGAAP